MARFENSVIQITGLPEYRNGGLCLDLGLLEAKHPEVYKLIHTSGSEVIVEWRALTVILLDRIADRIRQKLGQDAAALPIDRLKQDRQNCSDRHATPSIHH
ncbi:MAG: URC4/urg3 family protein [Microcoleus sp. SIO2G3]|nr:URC4/urg3 family protein [Microcoleus sp. SIO2G3]